MGAAAAATVAPATTSPTDGGAEERYTATLEMHVGAPYELTLNVSCTAPDVSGLITTFYEATATDLRIGTDLMEISTYTKQ